MRRPVEKPPQHEAEEGYEELLEEAGFSGVSPVLVKDGKVIEGKDGWLFLANDANAVLDQHSGERRFSDAQLDEWRTLLESRTALVEALGGRHVMLVAPDTHAICPEKLPDGFEPARERPIHQLLGFLGEPPASRIVYPLDELRLARSLREVCRRNDTHWNRFGSFVAYQRLVDELEKLGPVRRLGEPEVAFFDIESIGDLSYKLPGEGRAPMTFAPLRVRGAQLVEDNRVEQTGTLVVTECADAPASKCVLFGDSYSYDLLNFLAESFRRFVFAHSPTFDATLIESERPDFVLSLMAERFLIKVPDDRSAPSVHERARVKRGQGKIREQLPYWRGPGYPSLLAVERIRDGLLEQQRPREAVLVTTFAYAGLRPHELWRLRWRDVAASELHVLAAGGSEEGLDLGPPRTVRVLEPLADDLAVLRTNLGNPAPDELVFHDSGGQWSQEEWRIWQDQVFKRFTRLCGVDIPGPHRLRHTFCSLLIHAGLSPEEVAEQAGHSSDMVASVYGYLFWLVKHSAPASAERRIGLARAAAKSDASRGPG